MNGPKEFDTRKNIKDKIDATYPGGFAQLKTDWQGATTFLTAKPILTYILKLLLGLS